MIDPSGMMPYEARAMTTAPIQRPVMAPQFVMSPAYSVAPLPPASYATHNPFGTFNSFSPAPAPLATPYKQTYEDRPVLRVMAPEPDPSQGIVYRRDSRQSLEAQSPNPSIKSESQISLRSVMTNPSVTAKTITSNIPLNPQNEVSFSTNVDALMRAIQAKSETDVIVKKAEIEAQVVAAPSPVAAPETSSNQAQAQAQTEERPHRKRYRCDIPSCNKSFSQKTHLDIHRRAHTGDKPYMCKQPGCGQRFSQLGNLKTHERRHTGERPYECDQCGKRFAQRGNVRAHRIVHLQAKPYLCKLDDCNKQFTQLGNLKSHQNKFHAEALKNLTTKFMTIADTDKVSPEDRELWEYFATLYKNSNKGIKGRGKDRKVGTIVHSPISSASSPYTVPHPVNHNFPPINNPQPHGMPMFAGGRPPVQPMMHPDNRASAGAFEMFTMEDHSHAGHPNASNAIYGNANARQMTYDDRIYG